ncbi:MAG TPA: hypothetical protein VEX41_02930 [Candidatus Eisenbacteria bacterium]|nr:hypothetical protein [Candidatus Eisenbacteria bacterium]
MAFRQLFVVISAGALAATLAGCGASQGTGPSGGAASAPPIASPTLPAGVPTALTDPACGGVPETVAGRWQKTITPEDLPPELFDADTGVFVMTLGPGRHVRTDVDNDHPGEDEEFCWTADYAVYVTDRADCTGDSIGAYEWILRDGSLDFTLIRDDCFWRSHQTIFETWARVPA